MDKTNIVIFGAGGLARELWGWICNGRDSGLRASIAGFVVDGARKISHYGELPIFDRTEAERNGPPEYLLAVADPASRRRLVGELDGRGWRAASYIHESAMLGVHLSIGAGTLIFPRCSISSDVKIGAHVLVNGGVAVGHDCVIGAYTSLLGGNSINGGVVLGEGVLVGAGASIYPGRRVGDGATIGMGSVVFRNVGAGQTVFGNPARSLD